MFTWVEGQRARLSDDIMWRRGKQGSHHIPVPLPPIQLILSTTAEGVLASVITRSDRHATAHDGARTQRGAHTTGLAHDGACVEP